MADEFVIADLREQLDCRDVVNRRFDEIYQLAADMGGAGYVFTGEHDADIMHNSATINLNMLDACAKRNNRRIFYSSSACVYPAYNQEDPSHPVTREHSAYPAAPDSEYGWEKLFSERLYLAFNQRHAMQCRIARYHNIFGPDGTWTGGREKSPAAICRKVAEARDGGEIEFSGHSRKRYAGHHRVLAGIIAKQWRFERTTAAGSRLYPRLVARARPSHSHSDTLRSFAHERCKIARCIWPPAKKIDSQGVVHHAVPCKMPVSISGYASVGVGVYIPIHSRGAVSIVRSLAISGSCGA